MRLCVSLALISLCFLAPLRAGIIIGNLPPVSEGLGTQIGAESSTSGDFEKAQSFTIGGTDYTLTQASLRLECNPVGDGGACGALQSLTLQLFSDSGGSPGSALATLNNGFGVPLPSGFATYNFTPGSTLQLAQGQTYWIVLSAVTNTSDYSANNSLMWSSSQTPIGSGATYLSAEISPDGGASWNASGTINSFELDGTAQGTSSAPEPSTWVLAVAGFGLAARRRRVR